MKNVFRILVAVFFLGNNSINAQSFQWAHRAGLYAFDLGYGIGTDNAGNVYIAGKYERNANFSGTIVSCAGNHDIYLAKYSPSGVLQWVRTAGGVSGDYAHAIAVDGAGNSYVTGEIERTVKFGSITFSGNGSNDVFLAKYNTNGVLQYAKKVGGSSKSDRGLGISEFNGNVYITGNFQGTASFSGTTLTSSGGLDIFIAKYTTSGVFQWIKKAGGLGNDEGYAVSNDAGGNIFVTGYFSSTAKFGGTSIASKGGNDIFIAKYTPSGSLIWVKKAGGTGHDYGMGIKVDNSNRVFLTGGFRNTSIFGSITLKGNGGHADIFVARYTSNGDIVWARKAGGVENDYGRALDLDASSNCYITGNYGYTATFGSTIISGADATEIYFASYDANGNFRWVRKVTGEVDVSDPDRYIEMGLSISVDPSGNVLGSGAFRSYSTFGGITLKPWSTHTDVYVTKISSSSMLLVDSSGILMDTLGIQKVGLKTATFCSGGSVLLKTSEDSKYAYTWKKDGVMIKGETGFNYKVSSTGNYSVLVTNGTDTVTIETTIVTESKPIAVSIAPSDPIFCQDSSIVLKTNTGDEYVYQWRRNGITIPGANQKSYKTDKSGDYQVKIIQGACFDWSGITNVLLQSCIKSDSTLKTNNIEAKDDSLLVRIFPNPNSGLFTIEINMEHLAENVAQAKVEMINAIGQVVFHKVTSFKKGYLNEHIELENSVPPGVYFLQVTIGDKIEKTRMMLVR